ncbi:MAG: protein phosphatase 2C domain-containing protein, partial [Candidatus Binatia bacterium]
DRTCSIRIGLGQLHVVADGMGGHKAGALAAQLTIDGLRHGLDQAASATAVTSLLRQVFEKTNQEVYRKGHSNDPETQGMGSTAVLLLISDRTVHVAHVGDSRAYLYRNGRLRRLTTDHTKAQRMVDAAILTPAQAIDHPSASVLERAVGIRPTIEIDITQLPPVKNGDGILLCTDGLSGCVADGEIEDVLKAGHPAQEIPKRLFDLALRKGSKDNITVQYLQYGKSKQGGLVKILRWTAIVAVTAALLLGLIYLFNSYREHRETKLKEAPKEAQPLPGGKSKEADSR